MKAICRALALALVLAPAASFATKVPIPIEGATLNVKMTTMRNHSGCTTIGTPRTRPAGTPPLHADLRRSSLTARC